MSKGLWIAAQEDFINKNNREPTDAEMNDAYADILSSLSESYYEMMRVEAEENLGGV